MERAFRIVFSVTGLLPLLFMIIAVVLYYQYGNGSMPAGGYVFFDPTSLEGRLGIAVFRIGRIIYQLLPACFFIMLLCSLLTYFLWRWQLSQKHFNLQTLAYMPYLLLVILMHVPAGNPVIWFIEYIAKTH